MRTICLYFQVHQPYRLRRYRFFDIGENHYYYDDYSNKAIIRKVADKCYLPANKVMLDLINEHQGKFRICYSISGSALEQFERYAPEVIESFKQLARTGCVEFLAETYSHSLASLKSKTDFVEEVKLHMDKVEQLFGQRPKVFRNTELIYDDAIGEMVAEMGFKATLTEGAKHILGWKSPNYVYYNVRNPRLKLLLKNFKLSDDIAFRFSNRSWGEYPLTAEKYVGWLNNIDSNEELVNLFMDYETFGEHQWADSGIFDFLRAFPKAVFENSNWTFATPSQVVDRHSPKAPLNVPYPISWADEERDLTAWLGNELQNEAFNKLYNLSELVRQTQDESIRQDWKRLQTSDHFYYMCTKMFADGAVHTYFNPFNSPYDAFINYMNVLSDFIDRVKKAPKFLITEPIETLLVGKEKEDTEIISEQESASLEIDGRMTVKSLKEKFKSLFGISIRVYTNNHAGRGADFAEDDLKLAKITQSKKSLQSLGNFDILDTMTVKDFETKFQEHYKIAIQLANADDTHLLDNSKTFAQLRQ